MTTTPQNNEGEIALDTATQTKIVNIWLDENLNQEAKILKVFKLGCEKYQEELHQANFSAATWENQARYLMKDQSVKFDQIESLKQEVIEWRDDRQKVNAELSEELEHAKSNTKESNKSHGKTLLMCESTIEGLKSQLTQSNKKSELVAELVETLQSARDVFMMVEFYGRTHSIRSKISDSLSRAANL